MDQPKQHTDDAIRIVNNNNNIRFLERISKLYALTIKSNVMNKIITSKAKNSF